VSSDHRFQDKADLFAAHKKKDDLADSFLQGLWFINHKVNTFPLLEKVEQKPGEKS
jgi:hypothetical protein